MDWWSLGILIYEMINGLPPFYDANRKVMYHRILTAPVTSRPSCPPKCLFLPAFTLGVRHRLSLPPERSLLSAGLPRVHRDPKPPLVQRRGLGRALPEGGYAALPSHCLRRRVHGADRRGVFQHRPCGDSNPCQRGSIDQSAFLDFSYAENVVH